MNAPVLGRLFDRFLLGDEAPCAVLSQLGGEASAYPKAESNALPPSAAVVGLLRMAEIPVVPQFGYLAMGAEHLRRHGR